MAIGIGSNISSLFAQRKLAEIGDGLSRVFERLSSGQRINHASDDPAGLSVSMGLNNKSRVLNRALSNLNDGLSLLNIADGASDSISNVLIRMRELAEQSANGGLSSTQRANLNSEFQSLQREIRRIGGSTKFNSQNLFQGKKAAPTVSGTLTSTPSSAVRAVADDGSYFILTSGSTSTFQMVDTKTGVKTDLNKYAGYAGSIGFAQILSNGDIIYKQSVTTVAGSPQDLFHLHMETGVVTKLTNGQANDTISSQAVSFDGSTIVFRSDTQYVDGGTKDDVTGSGASNLYSLDVDSGIIRVLATNQPSGKIYLSSDGSKLAYLDSTDTNSVKLLDLNDSTLTVKYIENSKNTSELLGISNSGTATYRKNDIFYQGTLSALEEIEILNKNTGGASIVTAVISRDGTILSFVSAGDFTGENSSNGQAVFRFDVLTGELLQTTEEGSLPTITPGAAISRNGNTLISDINAAAAVDFRSMDISRTAGTFDIEAGYGAAGNINTSISSLATILKGLGNIEITSQDNALNALTTLTGNIEDLSSARGKIGSAQSRIEAALRVTRSQAEEVRTASGRILDADIASESSELVRQNILQQSTAAVLAQSNLQPELVLKLLGVQGNSAS